NTLSAWNLIFCGIATIQIILIKYVLNYHVRRPNKIEWIIADKDLICLIAMRTTPHTNHLPRLQRNRSDHAGANIRTAPSPSPREKLRTDPEIRMLHGFLSPQITNIEYGQSHWGFISFFYSLPELRQRLTS
ncbi:MAG: hypothetical protein KKG96_07225, partial [Proteobacteria bacterium]|nr:hypothetical protein [Pseudomonadota bacterium]